MKASFLLQRLTTGTYKLKRKVVHNIVLWGKCIFVIPLVPNFSFSRTGKNYGLVANCA